MYTVYVQISKGHYRRFLITSDKDYAVLVASELDNAHIETR